MVVDSSPITNVFTPSQPPPATVNEQRMVSAGRATARNRGGIPSPASTPSRRASRPASVLSRPQPESAHKMTVLLLPIYVGHTAATCSFGSPYFQMKTSQLINRSDLPADFLQKFWIESEAPFDNFLSRLSEHNLLFTVEVPTKEADHSAMTDAIDRELDAIAKQSGPELPKPQGEIDHLGKCRWVFLSSKLIKVKKQNLRGYSMTRAGSTEKIQLVEIKSSLAMLAPVDYSVQNITKEFGIKNTLRVDRNEPEKMVVIGA
jgi:hypothetical protein